MKQQSKPTLVEPNSKALWCTACDGPVLVWSQSRGPNHEICHACGGEETGYTNAEAGTVFALRRILKPREALKCIPDVLRLIRSIRGE